MNRTMLDHLIATITDDELRFIASADYGQDIDTHMAALRRVFEQKGKFEADQSWHPYEVVELTSHTLKPGHEREFALCTLLILQAVADGADRHTDLELKFDDRAADYQALPPELRDAILAAYMEADLEGTLPLLRHSP
jgi:hypothetical protein